MLSTQQLLRRSSVILVLSVFTTLTYSPGVFAITQGISADQQDIYQKNILTFDTDNCGGDSSACCSSDPTVVTTPGTGSPEGTTFPNLDPAAMAKAMDAWMIKANPNSALKGLGATMVASAKHADINPFLLVAIPRMENGMADPNDFNVRNGNNAYGRSAAPGQPSFQGSRAWYKWSSMKASVDYTAPENSAPGSGGDMATYIKNVYADAIKTNDFVAFFNKYAPPGDNNDTTQYIANIKSWLKELAALTASSGGSSSSSQAAATAAATTTTTPSASACCPPEGSTTVSDSVASGDKPNFIDMSGAPVNGTQMGHGKMNKIDTLVIHYVEGNADGATLKNFFMGTPDALGIQFNIGKTGKVYQYFPLNNMQMTYHTKAVNSHAIGIEITGADGVELIKNDAQFKSVVNTAKYLCDYYKIPCSNPKGVITGSSADQVQGMVGHDEVPRNDHADPDAKVVNKLSYSTISNKLWTPADSANSAVHPYMMKLRTAMGFDATPGKGKAPSGSTASTTSTSTASSSTGSQCAAPPTSSEDANMKKTITVKTPGKFITMPSQYSCPGRVTKIDSRIAADIAYLAKKYNLCADDGLANGHKSHGAGLAVDMRPKNGNSKDDWKNSAEAAARAIGWFGDGANDPNSSSGCAKYVAGEYGQCMHQVFPDKFPQWMRWMGYNGDFQHGDPWHNYGGDFGHIHIGWDTPNGDGVAEGIISTPRESVYAFPAPVPEDIQKLIN